jgi:lysophospholipase L1-like esterase
MLRRPLRYVALGDSYTIGTSVVQVERWPDQLVARLADAAAGEPTLVLAGNLAVNGWTSGDVVRGQLPRLWPLMPEFVTVLIGVNDVVQGVSSDAYRRNVEVILDALLARLPADRLLTVSTPDYTVTRRGADYGHPARQAAGIRAVNAQMAQASAARLISHIDVHDLSLLAADEPSLVADDGLHPSGAQYLLWAGRIAPVVQHLLESDRGGPVHRPDPRRR